MKQAQIDTEGRLKICEQEKFFSEEKYRIIHQENLRKDELIAKLERELRELKEQSKSHTRAFEIEKEQLQSKL